MSYEEIFRKHQTYGSPDAPTNVGLAELAQHGPGPWNAWRKAHPPEFDPQTKKWRRAVNWHSNEIELEHRDINFSGFDFGDGARLISIKFPVNRTANFRGAKFGRDSLIQGCVFSGGLDFTEVTFGEESKFLDVIVERRKDNSSKDPLGTFHKAVFGDRFTFRSVTFNWIASKDDTGNCVSFRECTFGDFARLHVHISSESTSSLFEYSSFGKNSNWTGTQFGHFVSFDGARFGDQAHLKGVVIKRGDFDKTIFGTGVNFSGDEFGQISFKHAKFLGSCDFSNRKFHDRTEFSQAQFAMAPIFHDCDFHQDIDFTCEESFPKKAQGTSDASRAYRTLKLAMNKHQATREEQFFFRQEMKEERLAMWRSRGLKKKLRSVVYYLYEKLSDYGSSVQVPFWYLFATWIAIAFLFATLSPTANVWIPFIAKLDVANSIQWLVFSVSSSLPLTGFERYAQPMSVQLGIDTESTWYLVFLILGKILALLFLFLMGLGLRNAFKMK